MVETDHLLLLALFKQANVSNRVLRWSLELQAYNIEFKYIPGVKNVCADALSRLPASKNESEKSIELNTGTVVMNVEAKEAWLEKLRKDPEYGRAVRKLKDGQSYYNFLLLDGSLCEYDKMGVIRKMVPQEEHRKLYDEAHKGIFAAHLSGAKIYRKLHKEYNWWGMKRDCIKWHRECITCLVHNPKPTTVPPLKPIVATQLYEIVGIDVLELGLTFSGNRYVVIVIDSFSKWCSAYPVPKKSAPVIAQAFVENWRSKIPQNFVV